MKFFKVLFLLLILAGCEFIKPEVTTHPVKIEFNYTPSREIVITTEKKEVELAFVNFTVYDETDTVIYAEDLYENTLGDPIYLNVSGSSMTFVLTVWWLIDGEYRSEQETETIYFPGLYNITIDIIPPSGAIVVVNPPDTPASVISMGVYGDLESSCKAVFASEEFKTQFPDLMIELQTADFGGHHNRLITEIAAGRGANDIEALEIAYLARFVADGGLTDLAPEPYNGRAVGSDLVSFGMSNATSLDGRLVAMPLDVAPAVLYWRKSIIDNAGLDFTNIPDWATYIELGKALTVDKDGDGTIDQYALTHPGDMSMIPLNGGKGNWFSGGMPYEPEERFMAALEVVRDIRAAGIDANYAPWSGEWINSFELEEVVTMFSGAWFGGHFKNWLCPELVGDWRVTYPPGRTYASYGGTYLSIPDQTREEKKGTAWDIITYLTTSENAQLLTFRTTDAFPALTTLYDDPVMDEPVEYFGGQQVRQIYQDISLNIPEAYASDYDAKAVEIFHQAIEYVITDGIDVETAYENAKAEMQSWM